MKPYDHPDWNALLAGIVAHPHVDLPRLVAADWLEENGDAERAAFIRLQCERETDDSIELKWAVERYRYSPTGLPIWAEEACPSLVRLDDSGFGGFGLTWTGVEKVTFRRGFPFRVACTADEWQRYGSLVVPRQPVEELVLRDCRDHGLDWWAIRFTLRHLRTVALEDGDYSLLMFLRRELPSVDILRYSSTVPLPADSRAVERPMAPLPRQVSPPAENTPQRPQAGPSV